MAATFRAPFPRALLIEIATQEQLPQIETTLFFLITQRLLQPGAGGSTLFVPLPIQTYIRARQTRADSLQRHERAA